MSAERIERPNDLDVRAQQALADLRIIAEAERNRCPRCERNSSTCGCWEEEESA